MKYCKECGHQLEKQMKYCTECGVSVLKDKADHTDGKNDQLDDVHTPASGLEKQQPGQQQEQIDEKEFQPNQEAINVNKCEPNLLNENKAKEIKGKRMFGRSKILMILSSIILIVLIGGYQVLKTQYDPIRTLQKMEQAIIDEHPTSFSNHLIFKESAILDEESFFNYVKDNEWDYHLKYEMLDYFENQAFNSSGLDHIINSSLGHKFIVIRENPVLLGLFKKYVFLVEPTELYIGTNIDDTEGSIKDKTFTVSVGEEEKLSVYPGQYNIAGNVENTYGEFMYHEEIVVDSVKDVYHDIEFDYQSYSVNAMYGYNDATVFIDGKSTKKTVNEIDYIEPVPEDSEVEVHAEWINKSGETIKSESYSLSSLTTNQLYFEFDETKAIVADAKNLDDEDAGRFVLDFRDAYENAVNYADYREIKDYLEPESHVDKELKKYINDLEDTHYHYDFTENIVKDIKKVDDKTIEVITNELFTFTNHEYKKTNYDRDKKYTVIITDDTYKIRKIDYLETKRKKK